ncbi:MAG: GntR family transcriptional regulator [Terriglobales bacterium]|jgi:DNA-binding LacI/PurR family transcriptional regulator
MAGNRKGTVDRKTGPGAPGEIDGSSELSELPKHRQIYQELLREIRNGTYQPGDRLPSEILLCERFDASRITVAKAIQQLQSEKLVSRISGSGTYVEAPVQTQAFQFGLLIPELGSTEIFEPICRGMMRSPLAKSHSLIWGHSESSLEHRAEAAMQLCQQYISQRVAGVFFAPIEYVGDKDRTNREIVAALEKAKIPIVLLDRCYEKYPDRAPYDLVGIDNHRAGYTMTRHLLNVGAERIIFATRPNSASTVAARIAGYQEALQAHGHEPPCPGIFRGDFDDIGFIEAMLQEASPDAIVCANDVTAATVMQSLLKLGVAVPEEIRIVGIDDVGYARFLPVPLTTLHQNCPEMGAVALSTMLDRVQFPSTPPREILLPCELIVRESCGIHLPRK